MDAPRTVDMMKEYEKLLSERNALAKANAELRKGLEEASNSLAHIVGCLDAFGKTSEYELLKELREHTARSREGTYPMLSSPPSELEDDLRVVEEFIKEVSLPPYKDSDLRSLLETLSTRAKVILTRLSRRVRKGG